jgi:HlyD family secretion protein
MKRIVSLVLLPLVVAAGVWGYLTVRSSGSAPKFRLARVERGPLTAAVSATGNLNGVIMVQVGSQVSGQIKELLVDFNSVVKQGQVVARIDPELFEAQVNQANADVDAARAAVLNQTATVEKARADVENARAALAQGKAQTAKSEVMMVDAKRTADRSSELFRRDLVAQADRDTAQANSDSAAAQYEASRANEQSLSAAIQSALAQLRVQEAALESAKAQVEQKRAALKQAQVNLDHTTIFAPVDGVVVSRAVDVGQTVAASLQAPVLFTIAQDLTKMQVETSVDEADVGRIRVDDRATFTVDAFPSETFAGRVTQIRKAAQNVQNVITYTVIIAVDNPGGRLLPGMTANVKLVTAEKSDVLKVPNAALRFRPAGTEPGAAAPATGRGAGGGGGVSTSVGAGRGAGSGGPRPSPEAMRERLVKGLGLSADQQKKLDPILEDTREQMMALRAEPLSDQERQSRMQKARDAARARIRQLLTPAQAVKYDEMTPTTGSGSRGAAGRVWIIDADGKAAPVTLTLGISDGTATEVAGGELKEGQKVIVGGTGATAGRPPTPTAPRLRL